MYMVKASTGHALCKCMYLFVAHSNGSIASSATFMMVLLLNECVQCHSVKCYIYIGKGVQYSIFNCESVFVRTGKFTVGFCIHFISLMTFEQVISEHLFKMSNFPERKGK